MKQIEEPDLSHLFQLVFLSILAAKINCHKLSMKANNKSYFFLFIFAFIFTNCNTSKLSTGCWGRCENAILYYLPDCQEIKGYVNLQQSGLQKVFQQDIPQQFRGDSMAVCIKYKNVGVGILMSDCIQSEIIEFKCILEGHK